MSASDPWQEREWESGWEDHEDRQRRRWARLTLIEKLAWLEEAHALALHLQRARGGNETRAAE